MRLRSCENCGEQVDKAKAFCPGCGSALIEEKKRTADSEFEASGNTVQFSKTALNMVLSDMGLNITEAPDRPSKSAGKIPITPSTQSTAAAPQPKAEKGSAMKWVLIAAAALAVLLVFLITLAAAGFYFYTKQT